MRNLWLCFGLLACNGQVANDDDDTQDTDDPVSPSCEQWCDDMAEHCPEEALHPHENCLLFCEPEGLETLPKGSMADTVTNTLGCRQHWVDQAEAATEDSERLSACAKASPSGGDTCGSWCEVYCDLSMEVCTDNNSLFTHPPNYASEAECMTACDAMGSEEDILPGIPVTTQHFGYGNTSLCRIHHLHAAVYQSHPDLHCNHASQSSTADTCVDSAPPNTVNYCAFVTTFCTEYIASTDSQTACTTAVDPLVGDVYLEAGHASFADTDRKTVGCLNYWAMKAPLDPATYCPMADWDPDHWDINSGAGKCSQ